MEIFEKLNSLIFQTSLQQTKEMWKFLKRKRIEEKFFNSVFVATILSAESERSDERASAERDERRGANGAVADLGVFLGAVVLAFSLAVLGVALAVLGVALFVRRRLVRRRLVRRRRADRGSGGGGGVLRRALFDKGAAQRRAVGLVARHRDRVRRVEREDGGNVVVDRRHNARRQVLLQVVDERGAKLVEHRLVDRNVLVHELHVLLADVLGKVGRGAAENVRLAKERDKRLDERRLVEAVVDKVARLARLRAVEEVARQAGARVDDRGKDRDHGVLHQRDLVDADGAGPLFAERRRRVVVAAGADVRRRRVEEDADLFGGRRRHAGVRLAHLLQVAEHDVVEQVELVLLDVHELVHRLHVRVALERANRVVRAAERAAKERDEALDEREAQRGVARKVARARPAACRQSTS